MTNREPVPQPGRKVLNSMASLGLLFGVVSILVPFGGISPLLAVVFSTIGLRNFDESRQRSKWHAQAGLVLGILFLIVSLSRPYLRQ